MIFVSHDRHFIAHLATAVLEVKGGSARYLPGDYEYYLGQGSTMPRPAASPAPVERTATRRARWNGWRKSG